jgi:hypothetical protein
VGSLQIKGGPRVDSGWINNTTTEAGLIVKAAIVTTDSKTVVKISDDELAKVNIRRARFHGEWNHTIVPRKRN